MKNATIVLSMAFVVILVSAACSPTDLPEPPAPESPGAGTDAPEQDTPEVDTSASPTPTAAAESDGEPVTDATPDAAPAAQPEAEPTATPGRSYAGTVPAPEFPSGMDWLNTDRPLTLEELQGKVVLLDFWTYGCINCMHIIPDLKRLEEEYPDELVVIGVHSAKFANEGDTDNIRQIILRYNREEPVVNDNEFVVWRNWGARAWPTLALVDPAGNVVGTHAGEGVYPIFKPVIESLVQEFDAKGELDRTPLDLKLEKEGLPATVLSFPGKVLADDGRDRLFIADTNHNRIVVVDIATGNVLNVIGSGQHGFDDGDFTTATFAQPQGMALSADGDTLYVADTENHAVRQVDLAAEKVTTLVGTGIQAPTYPPTGGTAPDVALTSPWDLALADDQLYIAMAGSHQIWVMDLSTQAVDALVGSGREGTTGGPIAEAALAQPSGLALRQAQDGQLDEEGRLYFADSESSSIRWADTDPEDGETGLLAGSPDSLFEFGDEDGVGPNARLQHPLGVAYHPAEDAVYVADTYNSKIKRVDAATHRATTFVGGEHGWRDGVDPLFYEPGGIDLAGDRLYVADTNNHSVRVVDLPSGETTTLVLKGIDRFMPSADAADFGGKVVVLDVAEVGAGSGSVQLDIELPAGYKVNDEAPSSMAWQVVGDVVELPADADRSVAGVEFPLELEATFSLGEGSLTGDFTIIYCKAETPDVCLIEQMRIEAPVVVAESGADVLHLPYSIELAE